MRLRNRFPTFVAILLLIVAASGAAGQDNSPEGAPAAGDPLLEEARKLSAEGRLQDAAGTYSKWLAENAGHAEFGVILIEAADSQLSIERALELLRVYTPRVQDPHQQELCRASQIDLLEMLGRTEQALGLLRSFPPTPRWLYRQAQLLYQEGLAEEAEKSLEQALKALLSDDNGELDKSIERNSGLEDRIRLLQARIYTVQDRHGEAENLFRLLSETYGDAALGPVILLAHYEYLLARGRNEEANEQLERLAREFPVSPELALAREAEGGDAIAYAPMPSRLLPADIAVPQKGTASEKSGQQSGGMEERKPADEAAAAAEPAPQPAAPQPQSPTVLVQTGSFRDRENAEYMVRDLKAGGFEPGIVEKRIGGTLYYRVVIGPPMTVDKAQAVLMKLKDASFEGVLLFPE